MLDDEQAHVIQQLLPSDVLAKAAEDGIADSFGELPVADSDYLAESFDTKGNSVAVDGFRYSICIDDHDVTGTQRYLGLTNKAGDLLLQPEGKSEIDGVMPFEFTVLTHYKNLFVLPADGNDFVLVVKKAQ